MEGKKLFLKRIYHMLILRGVDWRWMNLMWRICGMIVTGENISAWTKPVPMPLFQHITYMGRPWTEPEPPVWVTGK